jgi:hypothetical protein
MQMNQQGYSSVFSVGEDEHPHLDKLVNFSCINDATKAIHFYEHARSHNPIETLQSINSNEELKLEEGEEEVL